MKINFAITIILSAVIGGLFGFTIPAYFQGEAHIIQLIITAVIFAGWMLYMIHHIRECNKRIKNLEEIKAGLEELKDVISDFKTGREELKVAKTKKERIEALKRDLERLASHVSKSKDSKLIDDVHALQNLVDKVRKKVV